MRRLIKERFECHGIWPDAAAAQLIELAGEVHLDGRSGPQIKRKQKRNAVAIDFGIPEEAKAARALVHATAASAAGGDLI